MMMPRRSENQYDRYHRKHITFLTESFTRFHGDKRPRMLQIILNASLSYINAFFGLKQP
ncbi:hypothetical protein Plhal304r1_c032g0103411 [Plasmopara halstedii]